MSDADGLLRLQGDPEMMRYFGDGHTYRDDESGSWLEWHVAMWDLEGYGFWAVEHQVDDEFIGYDITCKPTGHIELVLENGKISVTPDTEPGPC